MKRMLVLLAACSILLTGCLWDAERRVDEDEADQITDASFYDVPASEAAGKPGEVGRRPRAAASLAEQQPAPPNLCRLRVVRAHESDR